MNITRFSVKRPIGITMLYAIIAVLGIFSFFKIGVELLPEVDSPYVSVIVNYPGASTESVEQQVTKPIEDVLSTISHFKQVRSATRPGRAEIFVELDSSADADLVAIEATKKVSTIRKNLPDDIDEPVVIKRSSDEYPIMQIAVTAPYEMADIYSITEKIFAERFQQAGGVADIELSGGRVKEISIDVDKEKLNYYGLNLQDIIQNVKNENVFLSSGSVYTDVKQTTVRLTAQYEKPEDIENVQIKTANGQNIILKDIAEIKEKEKRAVTYSRVDGNDAVAIDIYKASGSNIVDTSENVLMQLEKLKSEYPDYTFTLVYDQSSFVKNSLKNTFYTLLEGLFTTGIVLYLFLRGWQSSLAVMIAIPVSLIATFFLMYLAGFTFNMMSLMGMALCIGILVDDSIVVLENIQRYINNGYSADNAAELGRNEIGMAAVAMTLCDVVVFLPIAFMQSSTGQFFKQFGLTITFATLMSLLVSFTLTPMLASKFYSHGIKLPKGRIWEFLDKIEKNTINKYEKILKKCLLYPRKVIFTIAALFVGAVLLIPFGFVGAEYMPRTDESAIQVNIELPVGYSAEQTNEVLLLFDKYLLQIPEIEHHLSNVTSTESNGKISISLYNRGKRSKDVWEIADEIRKFAKNNFGDIKVRVSEIQSSVTGVSGGKTLVRSPLQLELRGSDMDVLIEESNKVLNIFKETEGVKDIKSSYTEGMPEIKVSADREKLQFYGVSIDDINKSFAAAIGGKNAGVLANDPDNRGLDTDITVKFNGSDNFFIEDIKNIPVVAKKGTVNLGDVAKVEESIGPITIRRVDKERIINIQSNLSDRPLNEVVLEIQKKLEDSNIKCSYMFTGQATSMNDSFKEMAIALSMSLLLIYFLLAVLYESVFTPLIRMFSLPLGLIGAIICLFVTNNTLNLYSLIGILIMDGLVAKNGTLLLDYTLTLMKEGKSAAEAIIEAGKTRLKPIFMTAVTMVVGMLPTALAMTEGSETRESMAWVIIGGMVTSTVFTLIVIPIIFLWIQKHYPNRI